MPKKSADAISHAVAGLSNYIQYTLHQYISY